MEKNQDTKDVLVLAFAASIRNALFHSNFNDSALFTIPFSEADLLTQLPVSPNSICLFDSIKPFFFKLSVHLTK
jgi:hypothetical protein